MPKRKRTADVVEAIKASALSLLEHSDLTVKQETFVFAYIELGNATAAYRHAYDARCMLPKTINECASRLLSHRKITARLVAWGRCMIDKAIPTFSQHMLELERLRDEARACGKLRAAIRAEEMRGRLSGLYPRGR